MRLAAGQGGRDGAPPPSSGPRPCRSLDIVVPAHNEERELEHCVRTLALLADRFDHPVTITIVDSGSTDSTWSIAERLQEEIDGVRSLHMDQSGRGRALRAAWLTSTADVVAYSDADLAGDPEALIPMVAMVADDRADIVVGSRMAAGASVTRRPKREILSRGYIALVQWVAEPPFRDLQCGMKVLRASDCRNLLPLLEDEGWFFDTELLLTAWTRGVRVREHPVRWKDRADSRVKIASTVGNDLRGLARMTGDRVRSLVAQPRQALPAEAMATARESVSRDTITTAAQLVALAFTRGEPGRRTQVALLPAGALASARSSATPVFDGIAAVGFGAAFVHALNHSRRPSASVGLVLVARAALTAVRCTMLVSWRCRDA